MVCACVLLLLMFDRFVLCDYVLFVLLFVCAALVNAFVFRDPFFFWGGVIVCFMCCC